MRRALLLIIIAIPVFSVPASARTWYVTPDGTGEAPTIRAAVDSAASGDTLLLSDGVYTGEGNRDVCVHDKYLDIWSESQDPEACVIDCEGFAGSCFYFDCCYYEKSTLPNPGGLVRGIRIRNAESAVTAYLSVGVYVRDCIIDGHSGTALDAVGQYGSGYPILWASGCTFQGNPAGAIRCGYKSNAGASGCTFHHNGCVLKVLDMGSGALRGCTVVANSGGTEGVIRGSWYSDISLENCVIAFNTGSLVVCNNAVLSVDCCDLYGNAGGNHIDCIAGLNGVDGNFSLDPVFCDRLAKDYTLDVSSPCAPGNHPDGADFDCGLIGSLPVACGGPEIIWEEDFKAFQPASYHMQRIGATDEAAYWDSAGQCFVLTVAEENKAGRLFFDEMCLMDAWDAEFDLRIGGGTGADGMTFAFCTPAYFPSHRGSWLDFNGATGYAIEFDTYYSAGDVISEPTTSDHVAVLKNSASHHVCHSQVDTLDDNEWHHVLVEFRCGSVRVWLDGQQRLTCEIPEYEPFEGRFGFTASTGNHTNAHAVDNVSIYRPRRVSRTWYVTADGLGDAPTIQAALDSATGCDTVLVAAGTYYEHDIAMKNGACLMGEWLPRLVTIDAKGLGAGIRCLNARNPLTRIEALTIENASECAIDCRYSSPQIVGNRLVHNEGARGAAINSYGGSPVIEANVCRLNSASENGGAICCNRGRPTIKGNTIDSNSADLSGGGLHIVACIAAVEGNRIEYNLCGDFGGGIHIESYDTPHSSTCAHVSLIGNAILQNSARDGGGVWIAGECAYATAEGNRIDENSASGDGGGLWNSGDLILVRNDVTSNSAGDRGGGLRLGNGNASVDSNLVARNSAVTGGGIYCDGSAAYIGMTYNTICLNTSNGGAGIHLNSAGNEIAYNIIALNMTGLGMSCEGYASPSATCNDIWQNEGGDYVCGINRGGNFSQDPLFCRVSDADFGLGPLSPCLDHEVCGRVGAYGQGCDDASPPASVTNLSIAAGDNENELVWENPPDSDFEGVLILYATDVFPGKPSDGQPVENGASGHIYSEPGLCDSFIHTGLRDGTTYYYSVFAFDEALNYSKPASDSGTPCDYSAPGFSISVLQNPYITNHLDIYVIPSEEVTDSTVCCNVDGGWMDLKEIDTEAHVYRGDYDLYGDGDLLIEACGTDVCGNAGCETRSVSASLISSASGGSAISVDGRCEIAIPPRSLLRDAFLLILDAENTVDPLHPAYEVSPSFLGLTHAADLKISYTDTVSRPEQLSIARVVDAGPMRLDSYLDRDNHAITAAVDSLGTFMLMWGRDTQTPDIGHGDIANVRVHPVPFSGTARISFNTYRPMPVRVRIISVEGKVVNVLLDDHLSAGSHSIEWDGTDSRGMNIGSGVYFYSIDCGSKHLTGKVTHLR
ncbi:MAG: hypothetical protein ABIJ00_04690 [Candidatus Eisenbacteria bacterium]